MGATELTARNLIDCYDRASVEAMTRGRGVPVPRGGSKEDVIALLEPVLLDPENIAACLAACTPEETAVLQFVRQTGGQTTLAAIHQQLWARGLAEAPTQEAVQLLLKKGLLLFPWEPSREQGSRRYSKLIRHFRVWAPTQVLEAVELPTVAIPEACHTPPPPPADVVPACGELLADLFVAWRSLDEVEVTPLRTGGIGQRHRKRLNGRLSFTDGNGETLPAAAADRIDFLFLLLEAVGTVEREDDRLAPLPAGRAFFEQTNREQLRQVLEAWVTLSDWNEFRRVRELVLLPGDYRGTAEVPTSDTLSRGRRLLLEELARTPQGQWLAMDEFLKFLRSRHLELILPRDREDATHYRGLTETGRSGEHRLRMPQDWERVEGRFVRQVLVETLNWLGVVELSFATATARDPAACRAFRVAPLGRAVLQPGADLEQGPPLKVIVQPSLEIIALDACENVAELQRLERFAELTKVDRACALRLTPDSIQRGLRAELTAEAIVTTLERLSDTPLPQNVVYSVKDWSQSFERVRIQPRADLLEVTDSAMLDELCDSSRWGRAVARRLTPTLAVLEAERADDIRALLLRRGAECREFLYGQPPRGALRVAGHELLVAADCEQPYVSYFLEKIAEPAAGDGQETVYRLSVESVRGALAGGLTLKQLADFLKAGTAGQVPTELLVTLKAWAGKYGALTVEPMVRLTTTRSKALDELLRVPALAQLVAARPSPQEALVPAADQARLDQLLSELALERTDRAQESL